ncbi:MAG TPA: hypothetical protein VIP28_15250 [Nocardioides sp.]
MPEQTHTVPEQTPTVPEQVRVELPDVINELTRSELGAALFDAAQHRVLSRLQAKRIADLEGQKSPASTRPAADG